ncbi:MAG TPA: DNA/RNA nuclease SfsA [Gammaproteobacteria bacterium]|jgi:sugar fermentation stimulation protein A|nr:DNA/RNA nuclease SfsA [Gammaproteobacteria bacterium]
MRFEPALQEARLERRYKRFLADVTFPDGQQLTIHCPNTGAMLGCAESGMRIWVSRAANPLRKYAWTWELVEARPGVLVGIHTGRTNALVREAIAADVIVPLAGYAALKGEVMAGEGFRVDFLLSGHAGLPDCYLEVKNVTAAVQDGIALFPDAVSERASRHLRELMQKVRAGHRAALCFCVQRDDVMEVRPADAIDPVYGRTLREAMAAGVEVMAYAARLDHREAALYRPVPVRLP